MSERYQHRHVDTILPRLLATFPAIALFGARAVGKTTTAKQYAQTVVNLDEEAQANVFRDDPDEALAAQTPPILIDEWQEVPSILGAVKRAVDKGAAPGQFLITGSVQARLQSTAWPGTGRLIQLTMGGLTVAEVLGKADGVPFLDRVAREGADSIKVPAQPPRLREYVEWALRGGFPVPALEVPVSERRYWFDSYIEQLITRDAEHMSGPRDPDKLRGYLEAYALNTSGVVENKTIYEAAGITRQTADEYEQLLRNLSIVTVLAPWHSNRLKRLIRAPKRYIADPALAAALIDLDQASVLRDATLLGRVLDTFVVAQLRAQLPVCQTKSRLHHLRTEQGRHEIDVLVELAGFRVIGIEIKASASPDAAAARHLAWLRDELGDRFTAGIVFHTGPHAYSLGEKLRALPICALWS